MKLRALLRSSAAVWTAPLWIGIVVFYFVHAMHILQPYGEVVDGPLWAPQQVANALLYFPSFAYAAALGFATWEGGRLRKDGVWGLAPSRSRYRVAAVALAPTVLAGWAIVALPVTMRLVETRLAPTPMSLTPLLMSMGIVCAYTVLGCALGHLAPPLVAAPLSAVAVFYLVAKSSTYSDPLWPRHVSGALDTSVAFGEYYAAPTVLVPFLFAAAFALAVAAWWIGGPHRHLWRGAAAMTALVVIVACVRTASGWGPAAGPVSAGHAPARCAGSAPRVCMAETGGAIERLGGVRGEIVGTMTALTSAGVKVTVPDTVNDGLLYERELTRPRSTAATWWLPLTGLADRPGGNPAGIRYAVLLSSVSFPCRFPSSFLPGVSADWVVNHDAAMLWAAHTVNVQDPYLAWRRSEYHQIANGDEVLAKVRERAAKGLALPTAAQRTAWFEKEQAKACALVPQAPRHSPAASS